MKRKFAEQSAGEQAETSPAAKKCPAIQKVSFSPSDTGTINRTDIANYVNKPQLTNEEKYQALCNVWVPPESYVFPANKDGRKFRFDWLKLFLWLSYSQKEDRVFCVNCVLFGFEWKGLHNTSKLNRLFTSPLRTWKVATVKFREHQEKSLLHKEATTQAGSYNASSYIEITHAERIGAN